MVSNRKNKDEFFEEFSHWEHTSGLRQQKRKDEARQKIAREHRLVNEHCLNAKQALVKAGQLKAWLYELLETHPDFVAASLPQKVIYYALCLVFPCAYLFNILLIYRPVEFIVTQNLGKDSFWAGLAITLLPVAFLLFEIGLSSMIYLVKDSNRHLSAHLAQVMVWITPSLLLATNLARFTAEKRIPGLHQLLLLAALMALAFLTDAVIVFGIHAMNQSFSFVLFQIQVLNYQNQHKECKVRARKEAAEADGHLSELFTIWDDFNSKYPESPMKRPQFNQVISEIINWWKGDEFLHYPDDDHDSDGGAGAIALLPG